MTRQEYNEFRYIRATLRKMPPARGCTCTIPTAASADYKHRLDKLYTEYNMHPASVRIDPSFYDDQERIIYIYGRDEIYRDSYGKPYTWERLYTAEEKARFAAALEDTWNETEKEEDQQMDKKAALQKIETARAEIERKPGRGAWARGVAMYAEELLDDLSESIEGGWFAPDDLVAPRLVEKALLNGASDWSQYSWGGSALIYDGDIAERLCNPTELKRTDGGHKRPNAREEWLDTQARALFQASHRARAALAAALG